MHAKGPEDYTHGHSLFATARARSSSGSSHNATELGNLTGLLAKIRPAVQATDYAGERSATNYGFVDAVARKNVQLTIADIHRRSTVLAALEASGAVRIAGAMYNIETALLEFLT